MGGPARGNSAALMRTAVCKDCQREIERLKAELSDLERKNDREGAKKKAKAIEAKHGGVFTYSEHSASGVIDRGGSRSDRCAEHRKKHRTNTQGMAVAYVDLATVGVAEGAYSAEGPGGPFGGLGPMPQGHQPDRRTADLGAFEFGMNDKDIVEILELLRHKRVLILKAGTGTGKSTFGPFRLMDPPTMADLDRLGILEQLANPTEEERSAGKQPIHLPPEGPYRLTDLGPIVVTEPRVAAATGVSQFVGEKLAMGCRLKQCSRHGQFNPKAHPDGPDGVRGPSCPDLDRPEDDPERCRREHVGGHPGTPPGAKPPKGCEVTDCSSHVGPGFPVGYHAAGVRNWDDACQLVFATDGAVINWLRDGRLSRIGTVIVDEAHERSTNIDFIMGYLRRDLDKYPHLRVIITSATFDTNFYLEYFGQDVAEVKEIPAVKTVGYGMPLFPELDTLTSEMRAQLDNGCEWGEQEWPLIEGAEPAEGPERDEFHARFVRAHWKPTTDAAGVVHVNAAGETTAMAPLLKDDEVTEPSIDRSEDLHDTTLKLLRLRQSLSKVPGPSIDGPIDIRQWKTDAPGALAAFVIDLAKGLDKEHIFGDILGFLPTARTIKETCDTIRAALGNKADVCELVSSLTQDEIDRALNARRKGDRRKIVISTNLAETSLTVEGVRFVVDTGLIAQSDWDPDLASGGVGTTLHSRAGIKQRWGRVGRKAPGWVFPLYTKAQYAALAADTPPGSTRENLEALMMTARLGGVDDVKNFPWPAAFEPKLLTSLDASGKRALETFVRERDRADAALRMSGAVNEHGHPTAFGKELSRFSALGSTASAMAVMYADRLACVPEVLTILGMLENRRLIGSDGLFQDDFGWPEEWRLEAYQRHRGLSDLAEDDAHLALLVTAAWERADSTSPWEHSVKRVDWCLRWWLNHDLLFELANKRKDILANLSPGMKKPVKRYIEPALLDRARSVLGRTMQSLEFRRDGDAYLPLVVVPDVNGELHPSRFLVEDDSVMTLRPDRVLALRRREDRGGDSRISNLIALPTHEEANQDLRPASSEADAMKLVRSVAKTARPDPGRNAVLELIDRWPIGRRMLLDGAAVADLASSNVESKAPFARPRTREESERDGIKDNKRRRWRHRRDDVDDEAHRSDTATELPGRPPKGIDEEALAARELQRAGRILESIACGLCDECLAGHADRCTVEPERYDDAFDVTAIWKESTTAAKHALSVVDLVWADEPPGDGPTWFEVVGYDGPRAVRLALDWRPIDADDDPAVHLDIELGELVAVEKVRLGRADADVPARHHGGEVHVFRRTDGNGRFLLREAHPAGKKQSERGEIATSLDRGFQGLLAELAVGRELTATVVPGRAEGAVTITFLEALFEHFRRDAPINLLSDPTNPKSRRVQFHAAVVETPLDEYGRQVVRLLLQDESAGIYHRFRLQIGQPDPREDSERVDEQTTDATVADGSNAGLSVGRPIALGLDLQWRFAKSLGKISVGGLDLDQLEQVVTDADGGLELIGAKTHRAADVRDLTDDEADDDDPDDETSRDDADAETADEAASRARPAPESARLVLKGDRPLSGAAAQALAGLDRSDAWRRRVWTFWARSHHLTIRPTVSYVDSEAVDRHEIALPGIRQRASDIERRRKQLAEFARAHPVGSRLSATVKHFRHKDVFVELEGGVTAKLPFNELSWHWLNDATDVVQQGAVLDVKLIKDVDISGAEWPVVSRKQLFSDPFALYASGNRAGDTVTGTVMKLTSGGAQVRLEPGPVIAFIRTKELAQGWVADITQVLSVGDDLTAVIDEIDFDEREIRLSQRRLVEGAARDRKEALVAEMMTLSTSSDLRGAVRGQKVIRERWKAAGHAGAADDNLYGRFKACEDRLFARLDAERTASRQLKESLISAMQALGNSTDLRAASREQRALRDQWKAAGHTGAGDDELYARFTAHEDKLFTRLEHARSTSTRAKELLVAEMETLSRSSDLSEAMKKRVALRDRWKEAGNAGKDVDDELYSRFKAAEDRLIQRRDAGNASNRAAKEALIAEAQRLWAATDHVLLGQWMKTSMARWKDVGSAGNKDVNDQLWAEFQSARTVVKDRLDDYYRRRGF